VLFNFDILLYQLLYICTWCKLDVILTDQRLDLPYIINILSNFE